MVTQGVERLPEHMRESVEQWVQYGEPAPALMGGLLLAVLTNNLVDAFAYADGDNARAMRDWAMWLYNDCPSPAWGTLERLEAWHARGGLQGKQP